MTAPASKAPSPEELFSGEHEYDWHEAFVCVDRVDWIEGEEPDPSVERPLHDQVAEIYAHDISFGDCAETTCKLFGRLKNGLYFTLDASCDATGWDCRAGGQIRVGRSKERVTAFGMTIEERTEYEQRAGRCMTHSDCLDCDALAEECFRKGHAS